MDQVTSLQDRLIGEGSKHASESIGLATLAWFGDTAAPLFQRLAMTMQTSSRLIPRFFAMLWPAFALIGCASTGDMLGNSNVIQVENPLFVPVADREFTWNQLVDMVDDRFRIDREERVRFDQGVLLEGRIETFPQVGSTLLEPWRKDSTPGFETDHATLQTIRRRATVIVSPREGGYLINLIVQKELEDLSRPEHATAGGATLRHDNSLVSADETTDAGGPVTLGWIPVGRDLSLEQAMLADLRARLYDEQGGMQ